MEFKFNLNEIFKNVISEVNYTLLPVNFSGNKRRAQHLASQVTDIVDAMGFASAKAQGLHHPITSAEKMKNYDHTLYLMIDPRDNDGKGSLVGLLKMEEKNWFLYDATGKVHEKKNLCVLDFYVHETKQRKGLGKQLYDFMLQDKDVVPWKLAIDKPTQSFLSFLGKHYGLSKTYPQSNNFVLFEGFFDENIDVRSSQKTIKNSYASETQIEKEEHLPDKSEREDYWPDLHGRHTAYKLPDTMGGIIGDSSTNWPEKPSRRNGLHEEHSPTCNQLPSNYLPTNLSSKMDHHSSKHPAALGECEDYKLDLHGRHKAFKLPDTMGGELACLSLPHVNHGIPPPTGFVIRFV